MSKPGQRKLIGLVKTYLTHGRNGHIKYQQAAYDRIYEFCSPRNIDPADAIEQGRRWLLKNDVAAGMNGIVWAT